MSFYYQAKHMQTRLLGRILPQSWSTPRQTVLPEGQSMERCGGLSGKGRSCPSSQPAPHLWGPCPAPRRGAQLPPLPRGKGCPGECHSLNGNARQRGSPAPAAKPCSGKHTPGPRRTLSNKPPNGFSLLLEIQH